jgi:hypothetical protein
MNTLDQWEAEAKYNSSNYRHGTDYEQIWAEDAEKILALIDLVRKKDEALKTLSEAENWYVTATGGEAWSSKHSSPVLIAEEALALTDELGHTS